MEFLKTWYYKFGAKNFTGHQVSEMIFATLFLIFLVAIFSYILFFHNRETISKSEYNRLKKENEKIIQQALSRADSAEKKSQEYLEQAEYLKKLNDVGASKATEKNKVTDAKIAESDKIREQEVKEINSNYEKDISNINTMPDEQRRDDICTRIEKLAQSDPSFNEYRCAR